MKRHFGTLELEIEFLQKKIKKLGADYRASQPVEQKRIMKKARGLLRKLKRLENILYAETVPATNPASEAVPDTMTHLAYGRNSMVNPDGSLFQTPKLEGSFLERKPLIEER